MRTISSKSQRGQRRVRIDAGGIDAGAIVLVPVVGAVPVDVAYLLGDQRRLERANLIPVKGFYFGVPEFLRHVYFRQCKGHGIQMDRPKQQKQMRLGFLNLICGFLCGCSSYPVSVRLQQLSGGRVRR
jgi:hypothetical protein